MSRQSRSFKLMLSAGAALIVLTLINAFLILIAPITILSSVGAYQTGDNILVSTPLLGPVLGDFYLMLGIYLILSIVLSVSIVILALRARKADENALTNLGKLSLVLTILAPAVILLLPQMLFYNASLFTALTTINNSLLIQSCPGVAWLSPSAEFECALTYSLPALLTIAFGVLGLAGAAYALGRGGKRYFLESIAVFLVLFLVLSLVSDLYISHDNAVAVGNLSSRIDTYGAGLKYLESNSTLLNMSFAYNKPTQNSAIKEILTSEIQTGNSVSSYINASAAGVSSGATATLSGSHNPADFDFGAYNPIARMGVLGGLEELGAIDLQHVPSNFDYRDSSLQDVYEAGQAGKAVVATAEALSRLLSCNVFSPMPNESRVSQGVRYVGEYAPSAELISTSQSIGWVTTTAYDPDVALSDLASVPSGWFSLMLDSGSLSRALDGGYSECTNSTPLSTDGVFYIGSITQYQGYLTAQMIYNTTIPPSIEYLVYTDNVLIVNAGNMNLSDKSASVYVDGKPVSYTQYFNQFVSNVSLQTGLHNVTLKLQESGRNVTSSRYIYVSPWLNIYFNVYNDTLSLNITNLASDSMTISGVNVSAQPPYFDDVPEPFQAVSPPLGTVTTEPSFPVMLQTNASIALSYALSQSCTDFTGYNYFLTVNTSYGEGHYFLSGRCI